MKYFLFVVACMMVFQSCGSKNKTSPIKKEPIVEQQPQKTYEYVWNKPLKDYVGDHVDIFGFLWLDTISPTLPKGNYTIYERPNGYQCGFVYLTALDNIPMVTVIDSIIDNTSLNAQWRLVKINTSVRDSSRAIIEHIELSEYSYPDYENSGYEEITSHHYPYNGDPVFIDGFIEQKAEILSFAATNEKPAGEIFMFKMYNTKSKKDVYLFVNAGTKPNEAQRLPSLDPIRPPARIRDTKGEIIASQKVRVYGMLEFDKTKDFIVRINAEAIKIIK